MSKTTYKIVPVIMVVYKSQDGWRGFCVPYDVTCNARTQEEAKNKLGALVKFYEEGLNKYGNPKNLTFKELTDQGDKVFFDKIWPHISKYIESKMKSYMDFVKEELNSSKERKISIKSMGSSIPLPLVEYYKRSIGYPS